MDQPDLLDQPFDDPDLPHRYRGKRAIVTGAASGIGRAAAHPPGRRGRPGLVRRHQRRRRGRATAAEITDKGGEARSSRVDVTDPAACAALVADVVDAFGGLDVLCNIAGIGGMAHFTDETPERFDRDLRRSTRPGPFYLSQAALPHLLETQGQHHEPGVDGRDHRPGLRAPRTAPRSTRWSASPRPWPSSSGARASASTPSAPAASTPTSWATSCRPRARACRWSAGPSCCARCRSPSRSPPWSPTSARDEAYYVNGAILSIDAGTTTG